ncbi:MAG: hypothetical protein JWO79_869 [Actinomycetia bacterium]|nr:hypothetical protein [Actinomycetes bacterium]MDQ1655680.1 hypothetical protein [Cryptosporangiaceae bacterium]
MALTSLPLWSDKTWRDGALSWAADRLAEHALAVTGEITQPHARLWATAFRIPTSGGVYWLKANSPGPAYEAGLVGLLARWVPGHIVVPLATDPDRGWLLSPDAGETLRSLGKTELAVWQRCLAEFAELQRAVARHVPELLAAGVPDQRPSAMPRHVAELLEHRDELAAGLPADRHDLIAALQPEFARWCEELDAIAIPASIQHDDLHDANILVDGPAYRFFDWGDACVGHPFGVLLIALRVARHQGMDGPGLAAIRDAYLEPWTAEYAIDDLRLAARLAIRIAIPGRSLSYQRALCTVPFADRGEDSDAVGGWLNELLAPDIL